MRKITKLFLWISLIVIVGGILYYSYFLKSPELTPETEWVLEPDLTSQSSHHSISYANGEITCDMPITGCYTDVYVSQDYQNVYNTDYSVIIRKVNVTTWCGEEDNGIMDLVMDGNYVVKEFNTGYTYNQIMTDIYNDKYVSGDFVGSTYFVYGNALNNVRLFSKSVTLYSYARLVNEGVYVDGDFIWCGE